MKILVQSDDYGFTRGVVAGMCDAFARGIITSTGLFANMPICEEAVRKAQAFPQLCLGIDINLRPLRQRSLVPADLSRSSNGAVYSDFSADERSPLGPGCI